MGSIGPAAAPLVGRRRAVAFPASSAPSPPLPRQPPVRHPPPPHVTNRGAPQGSRPCKHLCGLCHAAVSGGRLQARRTAPCAQRSGWRGGACGGGQLNAVCALLDGGGVCCGRGARGQRLAGRRGPARGGCCVFANGTTGSGRGRYCTGGGWRAWRPDSVAGQVHHQSCQRRRRRSSVPPTLLCEAPLSWEGRLHDRHSFFQDSIDAAGRRQPAAVALLLAWEGRVWAGPCVPNGGSWRSQGSPPCALFVHATEDARGPPWMHKHLLVVDGLRRPSGRSPLGGPPRQLTTEGGPCVLSFVPAPGEIEGRGDVTPGRRLQGGDGAPSDVRVGPARPRSSGAAAGRRPTSVALRFQDGRVHTKDALSTAVLSCGCRVLQLGGSGGD